MAYVSMKNMCCLLIELEDGMTWVGITHSSTHIVLRLLATETRERKNCLGEWEGNEAQLAHNTTGVKARRAHHSVNKVKEMKRNFFVNQSQSNWTEAC